MTPEQWSELEALFDRAMDLPPGPARDVFLREQTEGKPELRERLLRLIRHAEGSPDRVEQVIHGFREQAAIRSQEGAAGDWLGRVIGSYRIVREIGRGGMGIVFEAHRADSEYEKKVAIKLAPEWLRSAQALDRFREERQILARLEHPGICRLLDGGTLDGVPYFVMELIDGVPLKDYCRNLPLEERIQIFLRVCDAVQYAHERLVIHRDLKPANILVDAAGSPKLLDFGIATIAGLVSGQQSDRLLTPDYSSPEQLRDEPVSTRTDVYALGLILFELLTGVRAQKADTSSAAALTRSVCEVPLPKPSSLAGAAGRSFFSLRAGKGRGGLQTEKQEPPPRSVLPGYHPDDLRGDLDAIVLKAASKDPRDRYGSVDHLAGDLRRFLLREPIRIRRHERAYRIHRFLRRNWLPVLATTIAALSLVGGIIAFAWQARIANDRFNTVRRLATTILFDVHDQIEPLPGSTAVRSLLARTAADQLESLSRYAGNHWDLRRELASAYLRLGAVNANHGPSLARTQEALAHYDRGLAQLRGMPARELRPAEVTEARLLAGRARISKQIGMEPGAEQAFERAVSILGRECPAPAQTPEQEKICGEWLTTLEGLVEYYGKARRLDDMQRRLDALDAAIERNAPLNRKDHHRVVAGILRMRLLFLLGRIPDCRQRAAEIHRILTTRSTPDPSSSSFWRLSVNLAVDQFCFAGDLPDAEQALTEAMLRSGLVAAARLVARDPSDVRMIYNEGLLKCQLGERLRRRSPAAAEPLLREGLRTLQEASRNMIGDRDQIALLYSATSFLVRTLLDRGKEQEALEESRILMARYLPAVRNLPVAPAVVELFASEWVAQLSSTLPVAQQRRFWDRAASLARDATAQHPDDARLVLDDYEGFVRRSSAKPAR